MSNACVNVANVLQSREPAYQTDIGVENENFKPVERKARAYRTMQVFDMLLSRATPLVHWNSIGVLPRKPSVKKWPPIGVASGGGACRDATHTRHASEKPTLLSIGRLKVKTVPCPSRLSTFSAPPCASVIAFAIARPMPVPGTRSRWPSQR